MSTTRTPEFITHTAQVLSTARMGWVDLGVYKDIKGNPLPRSYEQAVAEVNESFRTDKAKVKAMRRILRIEVFSDNTMRSKEVWSGFGEK